MIRVLRSLLFFTVYTVLYIMYNGYSFGIFTHSFTIPFINQINDPGMYGGDLMMTMSGKLYSLFFPAMAFISRYADLRFVSFALYFLSMFVTFTGIFKITGRIYNRRAAFLTLLLLFSGMRLYIGGSPLFTDLLVQLNFVIPLFVWGLYFLLRAVDRWPSPLSTVMEDSKRKSARRADYFRSAFILGIAWNFHPMETAYIVFFILIFYIFERKNIELRELILPSAVFLVLAAPLLLTLIGDAGEHMDPQWEEILRTAQWWHIFPFSFPLKTFLAFLIAVAMVVFVPKVNSERRYHGMIIALFTGMMILFFVGTLFTEVLPVSTVIKLQLFRSCKIPLLFAFILFAGYAAEDIGERRNVFLYMLAVLFMMMNFYFQFFAVLLILFIQRKLARDISITAPIIFFAGSLFSLKAPNPLDVGLKLSLLIITAYSTWMLVRVKKTKYLVTVSLLSLLLIISLGTRFAALLKKDIRTTSLNEAQKWLKEHTRPDEYILADPSFDSIRVFSQRSAYVTWWDGSLGIFSKEYAKEWWHRMTLLGIYGQNDLPKFADKINNDMLSRVYAEFKFRYIVVKKDVSLALEEVFSNREIKIYRYEFEF